MIIRKGIKHAIKRPKLSIEISKEIINGNMIKLEVTKGTFNGSNSIPIISSAGKIMEKFVIEVSIVKPHKSSSLSPTDRVISQQDRVTIIKGAESKATREGVGRRTIKIL